MHTLRSETVKFATLPSIWIGTALTILLPVLLAAINANFLRRTLASGDTTGLVTTSTVDEGFGQLSYGLVGIAVLSVTAISSEYARNAQTVGSGRQISTSSIAVPRRLSLIAAKLAVITVWVAIMAAITIPLTVACSRSLLGTWAVPWSDTLWSRGMCAGIYWIGMSWIAFGVTSLLRNGIIPLALLITNASMVSFSLLAAKATSLAKFLPDLAAYSSFLTTSPVAQPLTPSIGIAVLATWAALTAAAGVTAYVVRDI